MKRRRQISLNLLVCFLAIAAMHGVAKGQAETLGSIGKNELKMNAALFFFEIAEARYERIMSPNIGIGISMAYSFNAFDSFLGMALPYFRLYPSKKMQASGVFIEVNTGAVFSRDSTFNNEVSGEPFVGYGLGLAFGYKYLIGNRLFAEALIGIGQELNRQSYITGYPNLGLICGYRF